MTTEAQKGTQWLLAIDPGKRACGCSLWRDGILHAAEYVLGVKKVERAEAWIPLVKEVFRWVNRVIPAERGVYALTELAIEWQQVYAGRSSRGDTQDLLDLSAVTGALCYAFSGAQVKVYMPAEWKHQVPTEILWGRVEKRLTPAEMSRVKLPTAKSLHHNVHDGVALGLVHLGRL